MYSSELSCKLVWKWMFLCWHSQWDTGLSMQVSAVYNSFGEAEQLYQKNYDTCKGFHRKEYNEWEKVCKMVKGKTSCWPRRLSHPLPFCGGWGWRWRTAKLVEAKPRSAPMAFIKSWQSLLWPFAKLGILDFKMRSLLTSMIRTVCSLCEWSCTFWGK